RPSHPGRPVLCRGRGLRGGPPAQPSRRDAGLHPPGNRRGGHVHLANSILILSRPVLWPSSSPYIASNGLEIAPVLAGNAGGPIGHRRLPPAVKRLVEREKTGDFIEFARLTFGLLDRGI